ncbi:MULTISPECIES: HAD-IIB family hydrolase [Coprobacillaceae]|uniref:HAD-IIB family hydrolase n=1 Tax=Coprobacillaceae TaxID=2810280 RepID=UPI000E4BEBEE|nr:MULTISPECIES: HAD-IIB family hydrolase [Coprobacillaceae]RHM58863.1 HAD-IIB family hydrolase [Coprobacillus sp. AF33-1AC]RHS91582.1 HAD-IIB family hydrolase [Erysipelatoclostridium sp. AM42-17]
MKLLASDFDGTLIHHQENKSYILKEDKQKIIDFQKAGNLFGVCSGRELRGLLNQSEDVKFDFYILHSGGIILDQNQHVIYEKLIGKEDMKKVIELFDKNVCWTIVAGNKKYAMNPHSRIPPYDLLIKDVDEVKEDRIATFSAHFPHDQEAARKCCELVNKNQTIVKAFQNIEDVDIVLNGCSKGNAIHYIQQYYHLKDEDINVIGDSYNDISMFDACHNSFTFFSSPQEVQVHTKTLVHNIKECIEKIIPE